MKAADVMVRNVVTVDPDADISEAAKLLIDHDISALPVVDRTGNLVGIVSEADLMRRNEIGTERQRAWWLEAMMPAAALAEDFAKAHGRRVREVMSNEVISAREETPLAEIASLFERNRIKRVPIIENGKLVGIVSRANLIQALASQRVDIQSSAVNDRSIRLELLSRLDDQNWTDFGSRNIIVSDGVVHIWGLVGSDEERKALIALAEEIPGVARVSDEMISIH